MEPGIKVFKSNIVDSSGNLNQQSSDMSPLLEEVWNEATSDLSKEVTDEWWTKILKKYSEDGRSYHNIQHLEEKFEHFKSVKDVMKNSDAVALAIFFHYYEYDPKAVDCEEKNSELFTKFADESGIPKESPLRSAVKDLLEAAATHSTDAHKTQGMYGSEDLHFFLDIDMAVLGSEPENYLEYISKVQQEYAFLPESMYRSLRLKVLQTFLQIPNIFASKEFREKFESKARANIQREVDSLKQ